MVTVSRDATHRHYVLPSESLRRLVIKHRRRILPGCNSMTEWQDVNGFGLLLGAIHSVPIQQVRSGDKLLDGRTVIEVVPDFNSDGFLVVCAHYVKRVPRDGYVSMSRDGRNDSSPFSSDHD